MKQSELLKQITDRELIKSLVYSQIIFLLVTFIVSFILFENLGDWLTLFEWDIKEIVYFGILPGMVIVIIDHILMHILPERHFDDGGINKRIFIHLSVPKILLLTVLIAFSEEVLFRGLIQTTIGYIGASLLFALVHFRYLQKPLLLVSVLLVSFLLGYMYELTENLWVTIIAHFVVDFLSGLYIRFHR